MLGAGIAAMHYTGMAAMRMQPGIEYDPLWFTLSIVVAMVTAGAALWIAHHLRSERRRIRRIRLLAALVMGLAVVGMHYTGMAAARFPLGSICGAALGNGVSSQWLASLVGISSFAILSVAIVVSVLDRRMQERTTGLSHSLQQANEKLTYLALHDSLTGLPNRLLLEDRLVQAVEKAQRSRSRFALLFMDLDGFKTINDAYGHPVGDRLLAQVAASIRDVLRVAGHRRPPGRRRIRAADGSERARGRGHGGGQTIAAGPRFRWTLATGWSRSPPASASRCSPMTAPARAN